MRAYEIQNKFGLESLVQVERPDPSAGPYHAVIKMRAASLNYRDVLTVEGKYNPRLRLPLVPLSDGVGEVVAVGEGVTRVKQAIVWRQTSRRNGLAASRRELSWSIAWRAARWNAHRVSSSSRRRTRSCAGSLNR
jgi:NADPH:quinone reductase-like Zn-dependent oxidoreductase